MIDYHSRVPYDYDARVKYVDVPFPEKEYIDRIRKVRDMMRDKGLAGLLVYSYPVGKEGAGHLTYLSSFWGIGGDAVLLLPMDGEPTLIFDRVTHGEPIHSCIWTTWIRDVLPSTRENIPSNIGSWVKEHGLDGERIGLVGETMLPWDLWSKTREALPSVTWVSATTYFLDIQKMKSELEMKLIRKVCKMTDEGMRAGVEMVTPGASEGEIIGEVHREFAKQGAHDFSFISKISSGPRAGLKHSYPTPRKIRRGDLVYIDIGARYYGYHTDMARVVVVGRPTKKQEEILGHVRDAYNKVLDAIEPGVPVTEIHELAKGLADRTGVYRKYGDEGAYINLALSHGMSTGYHEWSLTDGRTVISPRLSPLAFEPMISIMDFGIVLIESMVSFTRKGAEVLTPLKLEWM